MPRAAVVSMIVSGMFIVAGLVPVAAQAHAKGHRPDISAAGVSANHTAQGQAGHQELVSLVRWFAQNNIAWNLPGGLRQVFDNSAKVGDMLGPALNTNGHGDVMFDFEITPAGNIQHWHEIGSGRSFFMQWIVNPLGPDANLRSGDPGSAAYFETRLSIPLRRHVIVVAQYQGFKTFQNAYGEEVRYPFLQVIAAAATNGYYYVDSDWQFVDGSTEYFFDDQAIDALKKRLKPFVDDPQRVSAAVVPSPPAPKDAAAPVPPDASSPSSSPTPDKSAAQMSASELDQWLHRGQKK